MAVVSLPVLSVADAVDPARAAILTGFGYVPADTGNSATDNPTGLANIGNRQGADGLGWHGTVVGANGYTIAALNFGPVQAPINRTGAFSLSVQFLTTGSSADIGTCQATLIIPTDAGAWVGDLPSGPLTDAGVRLSFGNDGAGGVTDAQFQTWLEGRTPTDDLIGYVVYGNSVPGGYIPSIDSIELRWNVTVAGAIPAHTYPAASIDALYVTEVEGGGEDLVTANTPALRSTALGMPNGAGWDITSLGATGAMRAWVQFGMVANPVAPTTAELVLTTLAHEVDPARSLAAGVSFYDDAGGTIVYLDVSPGLTDAGTFTSGPLDLTSGAGAALVAEIARRNLAGEPLIGRFALAAGADDPGPIIDSIQLRINQMEASVPSNNCHMESANCMLIAVPLDATCAIVAGAPVYVTSGVGSFKAVVQRETATDYSAKNFGGTYCGPNEKGHTLEKWLDISGEFCLIDWAFMAATSGNVKAVDADGNAIGYMQLRRGYDACASVGIPRFAMTIIRKAAVGDGGCIASFANGATKAVAYTFPNVTDIVWDIPTNEDKRAMVPFQATGYSSPNAKRGPLNLYPALAVPAVIDALAFFATYFVDPAALPVVDCDVPGVHPAVLPA